MPATKQAARNAKNTTKRRPIRDMAYTPSLPAANAQRLRKGAQRRSNPALGKWQDGLLRFARNDGHLAARHFTQSVIAIARSAWRSRAESFSVSDFNWPQAARMSRPRGVRTGEE